MLRSLKSAQRKVRIIAVSVAADDSLSGLDANQVSCSSLVITFDQAFAEKPIVIVSSDDGDVVKSNVSKSQVEVSEACDVLIIGSDVTDRI